jgi:hypothetical protein
LTTFTICDGNANPGSATQEAASDDDTAYSALKSRKAFSLFRQSTMLQFDILDRHRDVLLEEYGVPP